MNTEICNELQIIWSIAESELNVNERVLKKEKVVESNNVVQIPVQDQCVPSDDETVVENDRSEDLLEKAVVKSDKFVQIPVQSRYIPLTNETIRIAVDKYCSKDPLEKEAIYTHGIINYWKTTKVTNMSEFFKGKKCLMKIFLVGMFPMLEICQICFLMHVILMEIFVIGKLKQVLI